MTILTLENGHCQQQQQIIKKVETANQSKLQQNKS
jgi:hypothetical protein